MSSTQPTPTPTTHQEALEIYKAMGPTRTLAQLSRDRGFSLSSLRVWSSRHKWAAICAAHDAPAAPAVQFAQPAQAVPLSPAAVMNAHAQVTDAMYATLNGVLSAINDTMAQAVAERDTQLMRAVNALTATAERLYKRSIAEHDKIAAAQKQSLERNGDGSRNAVSNLVRIDGMIGSIRSYLNEHKPVSEIDVDNEADKADKAGDVNASGETRQG